MYGTAALTNSTRVAIALRDGGPDIVSRLARTLELSRPTVESAIKSLEADGLVLESGLEPKGSLSGRPPRSYEFLGSSGYAVGVDLGPHGLRTAVADLSGRVVAARRAAIEDDQSPARVLDAVEACVRGLLGGSGVSLEEVLAVEVAFPGTVDPRGTIVSSPVVPVMQGATLAPMLEERLGCEAHVGNDTVLSALAEQQVGAGQGAADLIYIAIGRRVSVAFTIGGQPHVGVDSAAGSVAHLFGPRIDRLGQMRWELEPDGRRVLQRAEAGDPAAVAEVQSVLADVAHGVAALILTLNPHAVVLGGGIGAAFEPWHRDLVEAITPEINVPSRVDLRFSPLGSEVVVAGATLAALGAASRARLKESVPPPRLQWMASLD